MIKLGFIGLGGIAHWHIKATEAIRNARIVAGADPARASRQKFAQALPQAALYSDYRDLLKQADIDAVVICTPTLYHRDIAVDALRAGYPVLVEKPMARTVAHCHRMIDAADKAGKTLMVAQVRRYDKTWGRFAKELEIGTLGRPVVWRNLAAGMGPGRWFMDDKIGGGPLIDGAVHNYDFANLVFGDPESVVAQGIDLTASSALDTATAVVRHASGDQLMMSWSWGSAPGASGQDILGPKGTLLFGAGGLPTGDAQGCAFYRLGIKGRKPRLIKVKGALMDAFTAQMRHFLACVEGKAQCLSPGAEAIKGVAVACAVISAARKGGAAKVRW